ncbi:helix-turn-helix transcriptional regulator [Parasedimentitalea psychrophila]|uniref:Uncharacterized protein n=1 Tax=Parasedimentitalea psychrophila TaxID=2997337 RepID=A0A9Y2KXL1_9RHOB|nr:hypothetical protein [Parasedimentitalea psychrophila]WIY23886.1 hypothetical protein QPJ95_14715 [Parasedimentitalea psychrophila]
MHNLNILGTPASISFAGNSRDLEDNSIQRAFKNAKRVVTSNNGPPETARAAAGLVFDPISEQGANSTGPDSVPTSPIVPLGHNANVYYFISPRRQLRNMRAEALEPGRGIQALFLGRGKDTVKWCRSLFPARDNGRSPKVAGLWIIEQRNVKGVFDPSRADLRSIGVWHDGKGHAIAHCGDRLVYPSGQVELLASSPKNFILIEAPRIDAPILPFFINLSQTTLWRRTRSGALHARLRVAGLTRWRRSELLAFLGEADAARDRCAQ